MTPPPPKSYKKIKHQDQQSNTSSSLIEFAPTGSPHSTDTFKRSCSTDKPSSPSQTQMTSNNKHFQSRKEKSTGILICIILVFIACHIIKLGIQMYEIFSPTHGLVNHFNTCRDEGRLHVPAIFHILGRKHDPVRQYSKKFSANSERIVSRSKKKQQPQKRILMIQVTKCLFYCTGATTTASGSTSAEVFAPLRRLWSATDSVAQSGHKCEDNLVVVWRDRQCSKVTSMQKLQEESTEHDIISFSCTAQLLNLLAHDTEIDNKK
ncbi:unnamed protein product [Lepeophtheirus salmonis]|uniref:(salmon louse) hypothetical protein n=1 Tax=Lepeophtheirus salmonis TaxID=72036 RepID=A0A7R8H408_LEPSM|nr:unnamed protein product [Lepeophtheirus salmonis]CAF2842666.1 unnamed protein product [Lepeophtheirus salmonis]